MILHLASAALAKSWCASPVVAHEWGVLALRPGGGVSVPAAVPDWFERSGVQPVAAPKVRDLPADSGIRTLPVVQFWRGDGRAGPVPVAVDVGFSLGAATVWWPPVDALDLADPRRQLRWEALTLDDAPGGAAHADAPGWVAALRATEALWVTRGPISERFVFYEGRTREAPAVVVTDGPTGPTFRNGGDWPVHDLWVVRGGRAYGLPTLGPGEEAEAAEVRAADAGWRVDVVRGWVDPAGHVLAERRAGGEGCVTMRDPAVPTTKATGHALYAPEVDAMLGAWGERLFSGADHLIYREDPAALEQLMPVALYTDMLHWFDWRRLSVVLVEPPE